MLLALTGTGSIGDALFATLRCEFLQRGVNSDDYIFQLFGITSFLFTRQNRGCDFAT